jgi:hypothetical protein
MGAGEAARRPLVEVHQVNRERRGEKVRADDAG